MKRSYDRTLAQRMIPLLDVIAREILERNAALEALKQRVLATHDQAEVHGLLSAMAAHKRELRLARRELERFGCSIVGTDPVTVRIPCRIGGKERSLLWQVGGRV